VCVRNNDKAGCLSAVTCNLNILCSITLQTHVNNDNLRHLVHWCIFHKDYFRSD